MACNRLTNIDGKACNNISEAVNKIALSARLVHSCETGWNKHDSSYYSNQNSVLLQGKILAILSTMIINIHRANEPAVQFENFILKKVHLSNPHFHLDAAA